MLRRAVTVADALAVPHQRVFDEPAYRLRIDAVLGRQHAGRQRLGVIARQHRHGSLHDDGAMIQLGGDEMHRHAGQLRA